MPWKPTQATQHTRKAQTPHEKAVWSKIANRSLQSTGDEGRAIREANAVIKRQHGKH